MAHRFTIGVEEEFQIIDPATCELRSHVSQIVSAASPSIAEQVKQELHQSIVETGTRICENVSELRIEMHRTRGELVAAAERAGLRGGMQQAYLGNTPIYLGGDLIVAIDSQQVANTQDISEGMVSIRLEIRSRLPSFAAARR